MKPFLTQKAAIERAKRVEPQINNELYLKLEKGENFSGVGIYTFNLRATDGVFLDYCGKSVDGININNIEIPKAQIPSLFQKGAINLPAEHLKVGTNIARITFSNVYYHDGNGIHSFIDTDGKQYTYCQSEPFWTNKIYPVFDQPDLKGYMTFLIQAPSDWEIVSNTEHEKKIAANLYLAENRIKSSFENDILNVAHNTFQFTADYTIHKFKKTKLISTYLYNFVAGPFKSIQYKNEDGPCVPMSIYCRESLFQFAEQQKRDIFAFCKFGIDYYTKFFRTPFPFEKYDFIFCPEFTVGAMEYPGAVTFADRLLFRETPTKNQVTTRGMVILHELAHFWFGDLVTMKWWNDLWLNESFADFMCYLSMSVINPTLPFPTVDGWAMFQLRKSWGYNDDSDITTHPIAGIVDSTDKADSIFDGITYSKGASVLKQLYFLIGDDKFSEVLGNYFKKYGWSNATLHDLLEEVKNVAKGEPGSPLDMDKFNKDWIETAGHTQLLAEWNPEVQGEQTLVIKQSPVLKDHATLRYHKIKVAFVKEDATIGEVKDVIILDKDRTEVKFTNADYKAIILNYQDWGFVKVELDNASRDFFLKKLVKVHESEAVAKLLVIRSLTDMVRDAKIKGTEYAESMLGYIEFTTSNSLMFEAVADNINQALTVWSPGKATGEISDKVFDKLVEIARKEEKPDILKLLKAKIILFARSYRSAKLLKDLFEQADEGLKKLELTFEDQWTILFKLHWFKEFSEKQKCILQTYLSQADKTDTKKYWEQTLNGFRANDEEAQKLWDELSNKDRKLSYIEMQSIFRGLNSGYRNAESRAKFHDSFFTNLLSLIKSDQKINANTYLEGGFPQLEDFDYAIKKTGEVLANLTAENEYFQIALKKKINLLERRKAAFALYK